MAAPPFKVRKVGGVWTLLHPHGYHRTYRSQADAVRDAYRRWPWWP